MSDGDKGEKEKVSHSISPEHVREKGKGLAGFSPYIVLLDLLRHGLELLVGSSQQCHRKVFLGEPGDGRLCRVFAFGLVADPKWRMCPMRRRTHRNTDTQNWW